MRKNIIQLLGGLLLVFLLPSLVYAESLEDYEEARKVYLAAAACLAAYDDRNGDLAFAALQQAGWEVIPYVEKSKYAEARFFFAKKSIPGQNRPFYLLAVTGTENKKDVQVDLRWGKVPFNHPDLEKTQAGSASQKAADRIPMVHMGFYQYLQTAAQANVTEKEGGVQKSLLEVLRQHPEQKVYLVGHSLGGAVVTIGGVKLLEAGVKPNQVEVITFGAPAVGNAAFKKYAEDKKLNLIRVTNHGDPVRRLLQNFIGGYVQFGREMRWVPPATTSLHPHQISVYLDSAMKLYYDARQKAVQQGKISIPVRTAPKPASPMVYVAPVRNSLPRELQNEFQYMQEALWDEYRTVLPGYVLASGVEPAGGIFAKALAAGCQWVIVPEIQGYRLKTRENEYYITLLQTVYRTSDRQLAQAASYGSNTRNLTAVQALLRNAKNMGGEIRNFFY